MTIDFLNNIIFFQDITYINYEALMNLAKDDQIINFNNLVTQSHPGDNMVKLNFIMYFFEKIYVKST